MSETRDIGGLVERLRGRTRATYSVAGYVNGTEPDADCQEAASALLSLQALVDERTRERDEAWRKLQFQSISAALVDEGGETRELEAARSLPGCAASPATSGAEPSAAWQPVETALHEMEANEWSSVLVAVSKPGSAPLVGEAHLIVHDDRGAEWWWANESSGDYYADPIEPDWRVTHWMPLPPPPLLVKEGFEREEGASCTNLSTHVAEATATDTQRKSGGDMP